MGKTRNVCQRWDEMAPDILALIFTYLSFYEKLMVIPSVCKVWNQVVLWPCCWQDIDIETWSRDSEIDHIYLMLKMLITRSNGSMRTLCFNGRFSIKDKDFFSFIADK